MQSYVYVPQTRICYTQTRIFYMQIYVYVNELKSNCKLDKLLHAELCLCPTDSYLLHTDSYFLHADLCLCPTESYLLPAEFKSVHTSNSVKVLSLFHQISHQQEYSFNNPYIFVTLEYYDP